MEEKYKEPLEYEKVSKLLTKYAIPSIIAMLVSALYNIVDQIFIGQGVGVLGNVCYKCHFSTNNNMYCNCIIVRNWRSV